MVMLQVPIRNARNRIFRKLLLSLCFVSVRWNPCSFTASAFSSRMPVSSGTSVRTEPRRTVQIASFRSSESDSSSSSDDYSSSSHYLATCLPGLSGVLYEELIAIDGLEDIQQSGSAAVTFTSRTLRPVLHALLWLRTAHKLLQRVGTTTDNPLSALQSRDDLYDCVQDTVVDVRDMFGDGQGNLLTLSVHVTLIQPSLLPKDLCHSHYSALTIKNALVDAVRDIRGDRPSVDTDYPDVPLVAMLKGNNNDEGASLSLYKSLHPPGSLHRRGYRRGSAIHKAAMKESMAAGLLLEAGYGTTSPTNTTVLVDPMAGSGSLVVEAAMISADLAPGLMRIKCGVHAGHPPILKWKSSKEQGAVQIWNQLLVEATERAKRGMHALHQHSSSNGDELLSSPRILANDIHEGALDILEASLQQAGLQNCVQVYEQDCQDWTLPPLQSDERYLVVTNPPWGVRLTEDMHESWESLRVFLRSCPPAKTEAWVLSGNKESTRHLGLKRSRSVSLQTAQQNLRWIQYMILNRPPAVREEHAEKDNGRTTFDRPLERAVKRDEEMGERARQPRTARKQSVTARTDQHQQVAKTPASVRNDDSRVDPRNKSVTRRLTRDERKDRKNSWLI